VPVECIVLTYNVRVWATCCQQQHNISILLYGHQSVCCSCLCPRFMPSGHMWGTESAPRLPSKMLVRELTSILLLCCRTQTWRLCGPEIAEHIFTPQNLKMCGVTKNCLIISLLNCLQALFPATGHLDTGFSWFPCVYKRMLRWFRSF